MKGFTQQTLDRFEKGVAFKKSHPEASVGEIRKITGLAASTFYQVRKQKGVFNKRGVYKKRKPTVLMHTLPVDEGPKSNGQVFAIIGSPQLVAESIRSLINA